MSIFFLKYIIPYCFYVCIVYIRCILCCTLVRVCIIIINNNTLHDRAESNFLDKTQTTRRS